MASIRKYRDKFNIQIQKKGYPFISKSFLSLTVAKKWAITTEADMERCIHDLRHEATSRFFEKRLNRVEVATITGHKDTRMLMRYTHLRAEDLVARLS